MQPISAISTPDTPDQPWRSLHIFNIYRLIIAGIIAVVFFFTLPGDTAFGQTAPRLFAFTIICWLLVTLASGFASRLRWKRFRWQVAIIILLDIGFITLLVYSSGGTQSGLGTLMLITIAASGILTSGRMTFAFAAIAALSLLFIHGYAILSGFEPALGGYTRIGLLGVGLFSVALITHVLALRVRVSEALALQRGKDLSDLSLINELIIQQMDTGILVVSSDHKILMLNDAARRMLNIENSAGENALDSVSPTLAKYFNQWLESSSSHLDSFRNTISGADLSPSFTRIGGKPSLTTAIFLEDTAQLAQQAQQVKLASLGRLTASIAHEIRNPLSAINHAGQLLAESSSIDKQDLRLTEIIGLQSERLNTIVENILSLSRKKDFTPEFINIGEWLGHFMEKSVDELQFVDSDITMDFDACDFSIQFDPTHLGQVLCNLCDNALRHSPPNNANKPRLYINCKPNHVTNEVEIDIIDTGPGVAQENIEKLFEPFFTTEPRGTGLGLFIARELAELNNAHLIYINEGNSGAHFRLCLPVIATN